MKTETYIKICPKCGSTRISPYSHWGTSQGEVLHSYCENCNWKGFIPEIEESQVENFRKELKRQLTVRKA